MSETKVSLPADSAPSARTLADHSCRRCHIVKVVRHVPVPQLEALRETNSDDTTVHEKVNPPVGGNEAGADNNQSTIAPSTSRSFNLLFSNKQRSA